MLESPMVSFAIAETYSCNIQGSNGWAGIRIGWERCTKVLSGEAYIGSGGKTSE
jgi:hypothetical protein